jgi:hypothetical protein
MRLDAFRDFETEEAQRMLFAILAPLALSTILTEVGHLA